jgi:hypothetical protein
MCTFASKAADSRNSLDNRHFVHLAVICLMTRDDDLRVRIGRVRDRGNARRAKPFIAQALAAAERAGGLYVDRDEPQRAPRSAVAERQALRRCVG